MEPYLWNYIVAVLFTASKIYISLD